MVGTALIGHGYWGSKLEKYLEENPFFSLRYVCDSKTDLRKVFSDETVEAVVVATPIETHFSIVREALLSGKHVLSEKPLTLKTQECLALKELASARNLVLETNYVFTYSIALKTAKCLINSGKLGKLVSMEMSVKHLGRFGGPNVYWLLASHMLSVLDLFVPLPTLKFQFFNLVPNETASVMFSGSINGRIDISLNYPCKATEIVFYCEKGTIIYHPSICNSLQVVWYEKPYWTIAEKIPKTALSYNIDENSNLIFSVQNFANLIQGIGTCNIDVAVNVTKILELQP